jgi:hypothetical protein
MRRKPEILTIDIHFISTQHPTQGGIVAKVCTVT